jgi:iron(III) transport system substrate-binding protein
MGEMGRDPSGMMVTVNQYARAFAYNTNQVAPADVPSQWEDLLKPRWRGKMAFSTSSTVGPMMIGGLMDIWGRERTLDYVRRLGEQRIASLAAGPAAVLSQVASADFDGCYGAIHHVEALQARGAPVAYAVLGDTVFAPVQTTQLPRSPKHPHAALLFTDFLLQADGGQRVMKENRYLAAHPKVAGDHPALAGRRLWVMTPERMEAGLQEWSRIMRQYLR